MELNFLKDLVVIFGVSAVTVFVLRRINVPSIVGFLIAGIILGPHGFELISKTHAVEMFAEIGVILLLFTIGIEFSLSRFIKMKRAVIAGGGIQVLLTIMLSALAVFSVTGNINRSVFTGFLVALSSTAIIFKLLAEKGETDAPHGRIMTVILIFQDLCVILLMLLVPSLAGESLHFADIGLKMGKALLIIAVVLFSARWLVPVLLHQIVHTRSRELFIISIILLCLGTALLTSKLGLSLALGAFLAGLVISESEYSHQATSDILPFKESFIGLFFVSVGMLMNVSYLYDNLLRISVAVAFIIVLKTLTGTVSAVFAGAPLRISIHSGLGLAQIGEFSFLLAVAGKTAGIITEDFYQLFLSSSVVTMIATPFIIRIAPGLSAWITSRKFIESAGYREMPEHEIYPQKREGHVIIIGFGLNGRNLASVLKEASIPYVVLEMNIGTVRQMKKKAEPIFYGDGTSEGILNNLGIEKASLLVVAISDPASTRRIVSTARHSNPSLYIIVRTRYLEEVEDLKALGADEVIPEEFETSIEIFSRVLFKYNFPHNIILEMVDRIRNDSYTVLRNIDLPRRQLFEKCEWLPDIEIDGFRVPEESHLSGRSIAELQIRKVTGVTIIAVRREADVFANPEPVFVLHSGDILLFTGTREKMASALNYFRGRA